jgi:hypothetical protein
MPRRTALIATIVLGLLVAGAAPGLRARYVGTVGDSGAVAPRQVSVVDSATPDAHRLARAAEAQAGVTTEYDAAYVQLDYPGGDVPMRTGVCTDVVVRAFRELGVDLQVELHEDMSAAFAAYPQRWGLAGPDSNIDHRRVPNLSTYFTRRGKALPVTESGQDYQPGDIVTWSVMGRPHIGVVATRVALGGDRWCVAHNIGAGVKVHDFLFAYPITGHFRPF